MTTGYDDSLRIWGIAKSNDSDVVVTVTTYRLCANCSAALKGSALYLTGMTYSKLVKQSLTNLRDLRSQSIGRVR